MEIEEAINSLVDEFTRLCESISNVSPVTLKNVSFTKSKQYNHACVQTTCFEINVENKMLATQRIEIMDLKSKLKMFLSTHSNLEVDKLSRNEFGDEQNKIKTIKFIDGFIMEGKTAYVKDLEHLGFPVLYEKSSCFRATLSNGKILLNYPKFVGMFSILFLNQSFDSEDTLIIERSPISCMIFDGFDKSFFDFYFNYLCGFLYYNVEHYEIKLFCNLEAIAPSENFGRSFEMTYIKNKHQYAKIASAYYVYFLLILEKLVSSTNFEINNDVLNNDKLQIFNNCIDYFFLINPSIFDYIKKSKKIINKYESEYYSQYYFDTINYAKIAQDVDDFWINNTRPLQLAIDYIQPRYFLRPIIIYDPLFHQGSLKYFQPKHFQSYGMIITKKPFSLCRPYITHSSLIKPYNQKTINEASFLLIDSNITDADFAVGFALGSARPIFIIKFLNYESKYKEFATKEFNSFYSFENYYNNLF